jgi:transposase
MADALAYLRRLAIARVDEGHSRAEVARFLGVSDRSVRRWLAIQRAGGPDALTARSHPGRPPKLSDEQAAAVLSWLEQNPSELGFPTQRWTGPRVAQLIEQRLGVQMNPRYLNDWLRHRRITPQIPTRSARERDEAQIQWWVAKLWPHIKKKPVPTTQTSFSPMKAGF